MDTQHDDTRQKILDVTKKLFARHGVDQTTIATIAEELSLSEATVRSYFASKEEIFAGLMESSAAYEMARAFDNLAPNRPLQEALTIFGNFYLTSILDCQITQIYRLALHEGSQSSIGPFFYANGPQKGWLVLCDYLAQRIHDGSMRPCDVWIASMQLKGLLEAGILEPVLFGVQKTPSSEAIEAQVTMAVSCFMTIYGSPERGD